MKKLFEYEINIRVDRSHPSPFCVEYKINFLDSDFASRMHREKMRIAFDIPFWNFMRTKKKPIRASIDTYNYDKFYASDSFRFEKELEAEQFREALPIALNKYLNPFIEKFIKLTENKYYQSKIDEEF